VDDHWAFQRDALNLMAKTIAPIMTRVLLAHGDTKKMGQVLAEWDFIDSPDKPAPTVFQAVYREFALLVYADELGDDLAHSMLNNWYFWQERLQKMVLENNSSLFDNVKTANKKGATLYRGIYDFSKPYKVTVSASLRMVADLADPDKILAVLPGGVAGRQFDPHTTDQVQSPG